MRRLIALLFLLAAAPHAALSQTPERRPAAPPNPPRPVMSESVTDARLRALFDSAREAMMGMRFDEALRLSDEGLAAAPNQPAFWLNRSDALYARGAATYNKFYRSADEAERKAGLEAARRDFKDSLAAATRGLALINEYTPPDDDAFRISLAAMKRAALWLRAQALMVSAMRVDESYYSDAVTAFEQYTAAETDPTMLNLAHYLTGQLMIATNDFAGAAVEFRKVLDAEPDNLDATLGEAVALIDQGHSAGDPAKLRDGFERLRVFIEKAPEGQRLRASAAQALEYYKRPAPPTEDESAKANDRAPAKLAKR